MTYDTSTFIEMLSYRRPEGSRSQTKFCRRFLEPVFGKPDAKGNYILRIGDNPRIAYMSHHDTVHASSGRQKVVVRTEFAATTGTDCLGADCTSGIYIMLRMIDAGVEGLYIVHAAEEIGCKGSSYIATHTPDVVHGIDAAISFDRKGYGSVITHQMGSRTCSEDFALSLERAVDLGYTPDNTGSYTDSNEYAHLIPECTNVSVGYFDQHTKAEQQDLVFLERVADAFICADMSNLIIDRRPVDSDINYDDYDVEQLVVNYPKSVAALLTSMGFSYSDLCEAIDDIRDYNYYNGGTY